MLSVLDGDIKRFTDRPDASYKDTSGKTFKPPKIIVGFSNDGQISQLLVGLGVFDK